MTKLINRFRAALSRRTDYRHTFGNEVGERVLAHIIRITKANKTIFHSNQRQNDFLLGRQSVGYEILDWLNLSDEQIENLRKKEIIEHE